MAYDCATKVSLTVAMSLCALVATEPAFAQPAPEPRTVADRPREDLDPLGARFGSFQLLPELALQHLRDDNVFATRQNPVSDSAFVLRPSAEVRSDWTRNSLAAGASAALSDYSDLSTEDHDDYDMFVEGRWDTYRGFFSGEIASSIDHEGRESTDDARALERAKFATDALTLGYRITPGSMLFEVEIDSSTIDYSDVEGFDGTVNHDDRDRDSVQRRLRVGHEVFDGYSLFLQALDSHIDYHSRFDDDGFERSSKGYELVVGAAVNVTDVVFGNVFYGRKSQEYDDPRYAKIEGPAFGIDVGWNVTQLTTLSFEGRQQVAPTTVVGAAGIDEKQVGIRADHELLRNLIVSLGFSEETEAFKGIPRHDENTVTRMGARYLMNRRLEIELNYTRRSRDSNTDPDANFSKDLVSIQFKGQL